MSNLNKTEYTETERRAEDRSLNISITPGNQVIGFLKRAVREGSPLSAAETTEKRIIGEAKEKIALLLGLRNRHDLQRIFLGGDTSVQRAVLSGKSFRGFDDDLGEQYLLNYFGVENPGEIDEGRATDETLKVLDAGSTLKDLSDEIRYLVTIALGRLLKKAESAVTAHSNAIC